MATNPLVRAAMTAYGGRRIVATVLAILVTLVFGFHAFFGQNGITAYAKKREEDRALKQKIQAVTDENNRLRDRVSHLQTDPDTVETEARRRLHYTRPGEVVYTLDKPMDGNAAPPAR